MENLHISTAEAKQDKLFYVVANVILINTVDRTCLLLKRSDSEKEAGDLWAFPGGKGEHADITDGRVRNFLGIVAAKECKQETGLEFSPAAAVMITNGAFVREDGIPVFWATVAAPYEGGETVLEAKSFSDSGWFGMDTLPSTSECVGSVRQEAIMAIEALCD